jgi:tRNA/tmRNA/rRNA uracil-C5-methylase (TrmA/RlmC/RlmD family)
MEHFNVGFHKQGSFSQIQDYNGCILIDEIQNKIYKEIKDFAKTLGLPVYDQKIQK